MTITLDDAKLYLRIDDPPDVSIDAEIQSMIDAAIAYMELKTKYIWTPRDKTYFPTSDDGCGGDLRIYDFPINSIAGGFKTEEKNGYTLVHSGGANVTANVGYTNPGDIPPDIRNAALQLLKYWYYESEKQINDQMVPDGVRRVIQARRRFTI